VYYKHIKPLTLSILFQIKKSTSRNQKDTESKLKVMFKFSSELGNVFTAQKEAVDVADWHSAFCGLSGININGNYEDISQNQH